MKIHSRCSIKENEIIYDFFHFIFCTICNFKQKYKNVSISIVDHYALYLFYPQYDHHNLKTKPAYSSGFPCNRSLWSYKTVICQWECLVNQHTRQHTEVLIRDIILLLQKLKLVLDRTTAGYNLEDQAYMRCF